MLHKGNEKSQMKGHEKASFNSSAKYKIISIVIALLVFSLIYIGLPDSILFSAKMTVAIISFGIILWAFEPFPIGFTGLLVLLLLPLFKVADTAVIFSGFASPAIFLIIAGMMMAKGVEATSLVKRFTYWMVKKWGRTSNGLVGSILLIMQLQSFFIPATAVRATLMIPIASIIIKTVRAKPGSNLEKLIMLGVAYGGNISGTALLTAAIGNILTVEMLNRYADVDITYFQWFLYTFPLWLLLIPAIWLLLIKLYPLSEQEQSFPMIEKEMAREISQLGPMSSSEIRCLLILLFTVVLWVTEPIHHFHPSIPALIGVMLMTLPGMGLAKWEQVIQINFNTVLLLGVTLSMGYVFIDSGAADFIGEFLSTAWILSIFKDPILAIIFVIVFTQLFHKLISNVSTAVVTLIPIILSVADNAQVDSFILAFTAGLSSLFGYILVVETMPNLIVHSTGKLSQKDFLKPGIYATVLTVFLTIMVAVFWWPIINLI